MTTHPTVRPGRWVDGDHTQFASALDDSVKFSLNISEIPGDLIMPSSVASRYVLNGWVEGFGTR